MTRVICAEDCGNSPRRLQIKRLLTALARGDNAFILRSLSDDVSWNRPGEAPLQGKDAVARALKQMQRQAKAEMLIANIVTHGPTGAANGTLKLSNGKTFAFSHVYRFKGATDARLKELTEYLIQM